ncbi:hypothetical protein AAFF_G00423950 [Aldrovandia affinis]|uniref:PP1-binding domain-containing protein n=1 Tax=Aldrovandia affinis TaxID=143900 RepID=A0AAD7T6U6_9TELE|nr:hypothetical protein AAFF_G00423950 [Aldrovandia affinis]
MGLDFPPKVVAADEAEHAGNSVQRKKRVHFGVPLSPEFFDRWLPPSTPLHKGGTPAAPPSSAGSQLRSLLKTPQRPVPALPQPDFNSPSPTKSPAPTLPQPDFSSPSLTEDSPPPSTGFHTAGARPPCQEEEGKVPDPVRITAPVVAEEACSSQQDAADVAPGVCEETARRESRQPDTSPASPPTPSRETETDPEQDSAPEPPVSTAGPAPEPPVITAGPAPEPPVSTAGPAQRRGRKRKQPTENDTAAARRRPSRNAAVSASGKMKGCAGKRRWGSKEVDRSLYGKRDYASKNPLLSPITEALSSTSRSPTPQRHRSARRRPVEDCREIHNPSMPPGEEPGHGDPVASVVTAAALWRKRFLLLPALEATLNGRPDDHEADSPAGVTAEGDTSRAARTADRAASGSHSERPAACPRGGESEPERKAQKERQSEGEKGQHSPQRRFREGDTRTHMQTDARCSEALERVVPMDRDTGGEAEGHSDADAHRSAQSGAGDAAVPEPDAQPDAGQEAAGAASQRAKPGRRSGALGRPKGRRSALLCPRSVDFCIEDVLQPLPRDRRSVRRSLRNQSHRDPSASGLAWVPHPSPSPTAAARRSTRRGTRGRLSSARKTPQPRPQSSPTPPTSSPSSTHDLPTLLEAPSP